MELVCLARQQVQLIPHGLGSLAEGLHALLGLHSSGAVSVSLLVSLTGVVHA